MKKTLSLVLSALILILALLPAFPMDAKAANQVVMTSGEFVDALKKILDRDTMYWSEHPFNMGYYHANGKISFDCNNLGKAIIYSHFSGESIADNYTVGKFQRIYTECGLGDWSPESLYHKASSSSTDFTNIEAGEWLYMKGHIGYYIGDGQVIECTTGWGANKVIQSQIDSKGTRSYKGVKNGSWVAHFKIYQIDFTPSVVSETYSSYCSVRVTKPEGATVWSLPCSSKTDARSEQISTLTRGSQVQTTGLYRNVPGNYWYSIEFDGTTGYIWANDTELVSILTDDVRVTGGSKPSTIPEGGFFDITFKIAGTHLDLSSITGMITKVSNDGSEQVVYSPKRQVDGRSVQLGGSNDPVDMGLLFNQLKYGEYKLYIKAEQKSWYFDANSKVPSYVIDEFTLVDSCFRVLTKESYYINVNGLIDGTLGDNTSGYATFDVYIENKLVAKGVSDFWKKYPAGTKYEISNIRLTTDGTVFEGVQADRNPIQGIATRYTEVNLIINSKGNSQAVQGGEIESGFYRLYPMCAPESCLDTTDGNVFQNANIVINKRNDDHPAQCIYISYAGDGWYNLAPGGYGLMLDIFLADPNAGANAQCWWSNNTDAQLFKFIDQGDGYFTIVPRVNEELALDVDYAGSSDNTNIKIYYSNNTNAQLWRLEPVG